MIQGVKGSLSKVLSLLSHFGGYLLNDPTTPDLSMNMSMPKRGLLEFSVNDMRELPENSVQRRATNCHMVIGNCLNKMQEYAKTPVRSWAGTPILRVYPSAGQQMNAYYDRSSLKFFYYPYRGRNVYFSDSCDIVTHELGHAFLDAMRPDFWSVQSLEVWSFHEAFSDIVAMFNLMCYDKAIIEALRQTGGNMRISNVVSRLAEEVGQMIRNVTQDSSYLPDALRNPAIERFKYTDPSGLPQETPNNLLAAECHSFGRVFSGAWYEIFVRFLNSELSRNKDALQAFNSARDNAFSILMHAIPVSARTEKYYRNVAGCMISVAKGRSPELGNIVESVFREWNLLEESLGQIRSQSGNLKFEIISKLNREDVVMKTRESVSIRLKRTKLMEIGELPLVSSAGVNDSVKVEVPYDMHYEFDSQGNLVGETVPDEESIKRSVASCVLSISGQIGPEKMWDVEDGLLKRRFIV